MGHALLAFMGRYGYVGLAAGVLLESAGIPVPGETALIAAAVAASHGALSLPMVMLVAAVSGILGDNAGYLLGRRLGRPWLERHTGRFFFTANHLDHMDWLAERFGAPAVAMARFITGVRVVAAFSAGMSRMRWRTFLVYNAVGAVAWAATIGFLGYTAGRGFAAIAHGVGQVAALVVLVAAVAGVGWILVRRADTRQGWSSARLRVLAWRGTWVIGVSLAAVGVFAKIAEDVAQRESTAFDNGIRSMAMHLHAPALDILFGAITWMGSAYVVVPVTVAAVTLLWRRTGLRAAVVVATPLLGAGLIQLLKELFQRARPTAVTNLLGISYSFPSGHTTAATAVAATLAYLLAREGLVRRSVAIPAGITIPLLVGLSRIYLDVHWATDVIGGWAVGLFVATLGVGLYEWLRGRETEPDTLP